MKLSTLLFLICFTSISTAFAQKTGLINSGELLKKGADLHDSTQYKNALKLYDQISRSDTNYVRALYEKALTCEADSQFVKAIDYCKEGLALKDQREFEPDFYAVYGSTLIDMQKYDEGIKILDLGIAKYPQKANLYFNKALALAAQNRLPEAEAMYQKTLLISPYLFSAHYRMAYTALKQGKIVPAFLGCIAYLLMTPNGRYFQNSLNMLNAISKSTDEILEFKNKRHGDVSAEYQMVEEILLSKIAFDKQYKPIIALDDEIARQIQVTFEKLEYDPQSNDFYIQYYMPFFKQLFKDGKFELLINSMFSNVNVAVIKDYNKKNKKAIDAFLGEADAYFSLIRSTQILKYKDRDTVTRKLAYEDGKLLGKGQLINGKTLVGPWTFYYPSGNLKTSGLYSQTGERMGEWRYYYFDGTFKTSQHFVNGKLNGPQDYYYDNGNLSSHETELNGQLDGPVTTYYYGGAKKLEVAYKADKKVGIEKGYYKNGNLKTLYNYANGELNGVWKEFNKDGSLKEMGNFVNGKAEGPYKIYNEKGGVSAEMTFVKGKVEGAWKSYYDSGKDKEKRNYVGQVEDGLHQSYYENGQLSENYTLKRGKIDGEMTNYSKAGKVYSVINYENDVLKAIKYFDPSGKQLFASAMKNNLIDIITFNAAGVKTTHVTYNENGELTGPDTIFYPSGKVNQIKNYSKGKQNGLNIIYYLNGKKKSEINMVDDNQDGYYQGYNINGQVQTEGWIRNGEYEGQWVYHDAQGKLSSTSYYVGSELNGYKEEFDATGRKTIEQLYKNGVLVKMSQYDDKGKEIAADAFPKGSGKYTLYYPTGKVRAKSSYLNGELNGSYNTFYFDGSPESTMFYKAGDLDSTATVFHYGGTKYADKKYHYGSKTGKWFNYTEYGKLQSTTNYVNDMANGEKTYYNPDGSKDFVLMYKDDDAEGLTQKFDIDGAIAYQAMFENDALRSYSYLGKDAKPVPFIEMPHAGGEFKSYYANGKISREATYSDGVRNGRVAVYYSNGQLRTEDVLVFDYNNGLSKEYYPDGKLMSESNYVMDDLQGVAKEYYPNGKLKKEATYLNGSNHGPAKYYDQNGTLTKTFLYNYGDLISVTYAK